MSSHHSHPISCTRSFDTSAIRAKLRGIQPVCSQHRKLSTVNIGADCTLVPTYPASNWRDANSYNHELGWNLEDFYLYWCLRWIGKSFLVLIIVYDGLVGRGDKLNIGVMVCAVVCYLSTDISTVYGFVGYLYSYWRSTVYPSSSCAAINKK